MSKHLWTRGGLAAAGTLVALVVIAQGREGTAPAPAGRFTLAADTVVDTVTGLTWQRAASPLTYSWADAGSYCATLSLAGQTGWRLPGLKELASLVDEGLSNPAIDAGAFPATPVEYFWTALRFAYDETGAMAIYFDGGSTDFLNVDNSCRVRCVR